MRFSDEEKIIIAKMLKRMDIKKKRNAPQRNMTTVNLLIGKSDIKGLNKMVENDSIEMVNSMNKNKLNAKDTWMKLGRSRPRSAKHDDKNNILKPSR